MSVCSCNPYPYPTRPYLSPTHHVDHDGQQRLYSRLDRYLASSVGPFVVCESTVERVYAESSREPGLWDGWSMVSWVMPGGCE